MHHQQRKAMSHPQRPAVSSPTVSIVSQDINKLAKGVYPQKRISQVISMGRKGKNKQDKTTLLEENINRFSLPDKQIFETKANENREIFDNPKERKIAIGLSKRLIRSQTTSK